MGKMIQIRLGIVIFFFFLIPQTSISASADIKNTHQQQFLRLLEDFSNVEDRSCGTEGAGKISNFIQARFTTLGYKTTGIQRFTTPSRLKTRVHLTLEKTGQAVEIDPFLSNAISPDTTPGITGPVVYVHKGEMKDFNHKTIKGALVLMDFDSGENWINALTLGARAILYIYNGEPDKFVYDDKRELSPVKFPRFLLSSQTAETLFPGFTQADFSRNPALATLFSDLKWHASTVENIYCMIPGTRADLADELIIVESFYDTAGYVPGISPGADQSCSIASLVDLAAYLKKNPPARPVLLVATAGHGNALAGMREMIWSLDIKTRQLKKMLARYNEIIARDESDLKIFQNMNMGQKQIADQLKQVQGPLQDALKTIIDNQSNSLMQLRLEKDPDLQRIKQLASQRMKFKRFENKNDFSTLAQNDIDIIQTLIPLALEKLENRLRDAQTHRDNLTEAQSFRKLVQSKDIQMILSFHLSSHGTGIGMFNEGWLYDIKEEANTFTPYVKLNETFLNSAKDVAARMGTENILKDTLRPSLQRTWESYFKDTPPLGGEVSRLAGYLGLSLVTTDDARRFWNTPHDTLDKVNVERAAAQSRFISGLVETVAAAQDLSHGQLPKNGFATLNGRANFLRHGAVFADAPAPQSMILSFQGPGIFYNMVDESGEFSIKGISTKKLTLHKVILEGYKFDSDTGDTLWAVDKKKTTKDRYRVKITKDQIETDLVMFPCSQTSIVDILEPRTFRYMTRLQILDARMDATPVRYWYSRIDTRSSLISSIYLQPGTRLKLSLSDSLLSKKLILTHAVEAKGMGNGYRIDETPLIAPTPYLAAKDMWSLLTPRINHLEEKGINNQRIRDLQVQGNQALKEADAFLEQKLYDQFFSAAGNALAQAGRVYDHVETIQKDVLYGVLFYIVLFAPFAFCMERLMFAFINIYKRIAGFIGILILLIVVIYNVHPAFDLAYSPIVIILAFFIIGLSAVVTWIIFQHFENEMKRFQQQGTRGNEGEISLFKAFSASFFMGINNLRRRRVRTALTCTTLIILTFTIMSFTSVKSIRQHSKLLYSEKTPYHGLLIKQINWNSLPERAFKIIENTMADTMTAAPRAWLETENRTHPTKIPMTSRNVAFEAQGLIGLSPEEADISGLPGHMAKGRWFTREDLYSIIISERMAHYLNLGDITAQDTYIRLWSIPFKVIGIFSGTTFDRFKDLDGEPVTPAIFPDEIFQKTTEAEVDAMESGDDFRAFQSRYKHIPFDQTAVIPYKTLMSLGGTLKSVALKYKTEPGNDSTAFQMVDRFGLWLFSGEKKGVYLYSASDTLNYSGLPNVLIPILISIFIVLNTMIGSVQERKKEISIYTSIGMAPSHVSIIFIAEALAYAVISVVSGYILAQVVVKVFAGTALLSGLTVNYSSLGGVFAMAMVMLVVLLSAIYPSRVAASIAIPDVEKSWEMEKAQGNTLDIALPFLIKTKELLSISGFLYHLFDTHKEVTHGLFSVGSLTIVMENKTGSQAGNFMIDFTAWLAPFDLGIMQHVTFHVKPSFDFTEYMETGMTILRKSGEHNIWWRVNKRFVNLIRKQLLIWRSLDDDKKAFFAALMTSHINTKDHSLV